MSIQKYSGDRYVGLSTDTKPTNVLDGAIFIETDTAKNFVLVSGSWVECYTGVATDYDIKDLTDSTNLRTTWSGKQDAIVAGTDYEVPLTFSTGLTRTEDTISCDITQYSDSDAVSAIKADEDWNATNWDTAYGWGDHSSEGYLIDADSDGKTYGRKNAAWVEVTGGGGGITNLTVVNKVDTYSALTSDLGSVITMTSSSAKTINLPSVSASDIGLYFTIVKLGTGNVVIQAADSDTILDSSAGGTISNTSTDDIYSSITLLLISETKWIIKEATSGYWTTA